MAGCSAFRPGIPPRPRVVRSRNYTKGLCMTLDAAIAAVEATLDSAQLHVDRRRAREDSASYLLVVLVYQRPEPSRWADRQRPAPG